MNFAEKLKKLRTDRKMSQEELAKALNVSTRTISNYESGARYPRYRKVYQQLAEIFGCEVSYLLTEDADFITSAGEEYGSRGKKQAKELLDGVSAMFAGGEMSEEDMDEMMRALQDAYWLAKQKNRKFVPNKYRKDEQKDS